MGTERTVVGDGERHRERDRKRPEPRKVVEYNTLRDKNKNMTYNGS